MFRKQTREGKGEYSETYRYKLIPKALNIFVNDSCYILTVGIDEALYVIVATMERYTSTPQ